MPREYVKSMFQGERQTVETSPGNFQIVEPLPAYRAEVCWGTNDYVQVATTNPSAALGSLESGLYVDLDRKGINDLIRLLRKARDRAYGRDE